MIAHAERLEPRERGGAARRLRLGALQRAPLPRRGRRRRARPSGSTRSSATGRAGAAASCGSRGSCSWRARPTRPRTRAQRAVRMLRTEGDAAALAYATLYLGAILALTAQAAEATPVLERADRARAGLRAARPRRAVPELPGDRARRGGRRRTGLETMRNSIAIARAGGHHEATARGYTNLGELLLRAGPPRRARALRARRAGVHARARASGRTPTTSRCTAACCCCGAASGTRPSAGCAR